jgi:hypothetical protein
MEEDREAGTMSDIFNTTACGIPCQVEVTSYRPGTPDGRWEPGDPTEIEWQLLDRRGRRAPWLERKLTQAQNDDLEQEAITFMEGVVDVDDGEDDGGDDGYY